MIACCQTENGNVVNFQPGLSSARINLRTTHHPSTKGSGYASTGAHLDWVSLRAVATALCGRGWSRAATATERRGHSGSNPISGWALSSADRRADDNEVGGHKDNDQKPWRFSGVWMNIGASTKRVAAATSDRGSLTCFNLCFYGVP